MFYLCFFYFTGPIASALVNRFGSRAVTIVGSIISAFSFVISNYSPNLIVFHLSYGLLGGRTLIVMFSLFCSAMFSAFNRAH